MSNDDMKKSLIMPKKVNKPINRKNSNFSLFNQQNFESHINRIHTQQPDATLDYTAANVSLYAKAKIPASGFAW